MAPRRRRLPDERQSITHKFDIAGHEGYITVGLYEDGQPGELFLTMAKEGSTISGFADAFAQAISYALQYGVPLQDLVDKFSHVRFEPSGMTKNADIRFAKSIVDYIFRWLAVKFLSVDAQFRAGVNNREEATSPEQLILDVAAARPGDAASATPERLRPGGADPKKSTFAAIQNQEDAPPCSTCGSIMVRSGACYKCSNCGTTSAARDGLKTDHHEAHEAGEGREDFDVELLDNKGRLCRPLLFQWLLLSAQYSQHPPPQTDTRLTIARGSTSKITQVLQSAEYAESATL